MTNAVKSLWKIWKALRPRSNGKRLTPLILILIFAMISTCMKIPQTSSEYAIKIPEKPVLQIGPQIDQNCYRVDGGKSNPCIWFTFDDFNAIRLWSMNVERELKAACLAMGNSHEKCKTKEPTK